MKSTENKIQVVECPRDAMQGIKAFIPTEEKVEYLNQLLRIGFHTIDAGSFVSPHAIPQMADTALVLSKIDYDDSCSKLLSIVANLRGAQEACYFSEVSYLGFPFSVSETFQKRNTNSSIEESLGTVEKIYSLSQRANKELVVYLSMGFGNPYGDLWNEDVVTSWAMKLASIGIKIISLADTVGVAKPQNISSLFKQLIPALPQVQFGAHFHSAPNNWEEKISSAFENGCLRFDAAMKGIGGCPMANDELVGNMATENLIAYFSKKETGLSIDMEKFSIAIKKADALFSQYH